MNAFDLLQEKKIGWLIAAFAVLGTVVAAIAYIDQKKHNELQKEVIELDKELKRLQLEKIKNGN
jgi:uncharacterized membrane protein (DUF106 family)